MFNVVLQFMLEWNFQDHALWKIMSTKTKNVLSNVSKIHQTHGYSTLSLLFHFSQRSQTSTHTGMLVSFITVFFKFPLILCQLKKNCFVPVYFCIWTRYGRHKFNQLFSVWYIRNLPLKTLFLREIIKKVSALYNHEHKTLDSKGLIVCFAVIEQ